ncbi:hydroxysqualene dehydroxylase HpnE [Chitinimonas sp.]|uniref:hydroxysqualene dehydroxylase HpnE n=1 Tax=Chitinimonas sp. TaxID=1934313 RepID=UPI0035B002E1
MKTSSRVAIIGGGYAGMAAAVELAGAGVAVTVFEAGPLPGGRARRVVIDDLVLDNGQHMLVGAYSSLLGLMEKVGLDEAAALHRQPLDLDVLAADGRAAFRLRCPVLPAPMHTLVGLLGAAGLSWPQRWAAIRSMTRARLRGWRLAQDCSVADWLRAEQQPEILVRCLWEPLTLAALNTPIHLASAQVLLNVLRDSLAGSRSASDFLLPRIDLSSLFAEAAADFVRQHGGEVRCSAMVRHIQQNGAAWQLDRAEAPFDQLIIALPPHRLAMLADGVDALRAPLAMLANWHYQPIYTVYLRYPPGTRLAKPMLGLVGTSSQWLFDRGQLCGQDGLLAVVISAAGPHDALGHTELAQLVSDEVAKAQPQLPAPIWHKVIAEKRATFACTPNLPRPTNATADPGLWLAGDYTAGDYPATLEGAVRSGLQAARGVLAMHKLIG